ncbi:ABC transporter permease [Geodermatophilus ruber]|uniref:ABC-type nitrate/sulfonate/bicarbonate transport system, permease component n=1 Tax=Geodermatophilus ruber TaxID=504800 RepID=A0A1I4C7G7_9ACTN|nr:ABC transporter permease [Geodermatophilus ruber]SFK77042.1 ABC-type nitrate/sulfonate/bicarbonate transport system, permease component [Geodermatophilus ruber]
MTTTEIRTTDAANPGPAAPGKGGLRGTARLSKRLAVDFGALVVLVALWQLATSAATTPFFPTPLEIVENFGKMFFTGPPEHLFLTDAATGDVFASLWRMLLGYAIGCAWGIIVGTLLGRSRAAREYTDPVVELLRSIPATASLPLFILVLGGGDFMRVAFIAWGVSWFVLINTASGVASIHATMLAMGRAFRVSRVRQLFGIILPAAMPKILAGMRIGLTAALILVVTSEFMVATNGIGFQLIQAQRRFQVLDMWTWMLLLAVLGYLLNTILEVTEGRLLAWHRKARD